MNTNLHVRPIKSSSFYCLRSPRAKDQVFFSSNEPLACSHKFRSFFFKINCLIYTCMNAFKAGHIYIYIYLTVKQAYHHHKNDGRVEISDVCGDRLFDRRRFRLLSHLFIQFNSTLCDIDFFCILNGLS